MVIDKGKLIALLVDKTGSSKQEVENQLQQLAKQIEEAARSGRQFHIEGFGTFGMDEEMLYFDPDSRLKTEINQKYAGMKPIELMAAFKDTGAGVPVDKTEEKAVPDQPETESEEAPEESEPVTGEIEEKDPEKAGKKTEPEKKAETQKPEKKKSKPKKEKEKQKAAAVASAASKRKRGPNKKVIRGSGSKAVDGLGKMFILALILIGLFAAGWLIYYNGTGDPSSRENMGTAAPDTTDQVTTSQDSLQAGAAADSVEQNAGAGVSDSTAVNQATSETYGLRGSVNEQADNAFTIVIHSFRLRSTVEGIADSLNQEGYRTVLFDDVVDGESRWRLGLGQFETIPDAQAAVPELSAAYRENNFITRIQ